ncbi:MAG: RDD family protein [Planctomycetota bacterium]
MEPRPAPLWRRSAAALIDLVLVSGLLAAVACWTLGSEEFLRSLRLAEDEPWYTLLLRRSLLRDAALPALLGYGALLESTPLEGTLGKRLLGLRVRTPAGDPASVLRAVGRNACKWFSLASLGLGFAWALARADRRTWHDLWAMTAVSR